MFSLRAQKPVAAQNVSFREQELESILMADRWKRLAGMVRLFRADIVVLVARKMPRIVQLLGLDLCPNGLVVTDLALPFIHELLPGSRVAIVDDVVNQGSTLVNAAKISSSCGASEVRCFALAGRNSNQMPSAIPVDYEHAKPVPMAEIDDYAWRVPAALKLSSDPYDIDFPIFQARMIDQFCSANNLFSFLIDNFGQSHVHNLSTTIGSNHGLYRFTVDLDKPSIDNCKIRLYLDEQNNTVSILPCAIPSPIPLGSPYLDLSELPTTLLAYLTEQLNTTPSHATLWQEEPLARATIFAHSLEIGLQIQELLSELVDFSYNSAPFDLDMASLVFGPDISNAIVNPGSTSPQKIHTHYQSSEEYTKKSISSLLKYLLANEEVNFVDRVREKAESSALRHHFNAYIKVLSELTGAMDQKMYSLDYPFSREEVSRNPYLRLRVGFTFQDLVHLVRTTCPQPEYARSLNNTVSFLLDKSIDEGLVVPVLCKLEGKIERVYRRGEPEAKDSSFNLAGFAWHNHGQPMSLTRFTKILAILGYSAKIDELFDPASEEFGIVSTTRQTVLDYDKTELAKLMLHTGKLVRQ